MNPVDDLPSDLANESRLTNEDGEEVTKRANQNQGIQSILRTTLAKYRGKKDRRRSSFRLGEYLLRNYFPYE